MLACVCMCLAVDCGFVVVVCVGFFVVVFFWGGGLENNKTNGREGHLFRYCFCEELFIWCCFNFAHN